MDITQGMHGVFMALCTCADPTFQRRSCAGLPDGPNFHTLSHLLVLRERCAKPTYRDCLVWFDSALRRLRGKLMFILIRTDVKNGHFSSEIFIRLHLTLCIQLKTKDWLVDRDALIVRGRLHTNKKEKHLLCFSTVPLHDQSLRSEERGGPRTKPWMRFDSKNVVCAVTCAMKAWWFASWDADQNFNSNRMSGFFYVKLAASSSAIVHSYALWRSRPREMFCRYATEH